MDTPAGYFDKGYKARHDGLPHSACPLIFKSWPSECWQLGWRFADIETNARSNQMQEQPLERIFKRPFDQGGVAFLNGFSIDDCPFEPLSADHLQWQAGWIATKDSSEKRNQAKQTETFSRWFMYGLLIMLVIAALMWAY